MNTYSVYIITNTSHRVLYVGVTSNLLRRTNQHKNKFYPKSFSAKYNLNKLVYYETAESMGSAIAREKQLKAGSRKQKLDLIKQFNPQFNDLMEEIQG